MSLKPGETRKVTFSFRQNISGDSFICNFTGMTGWSSKADRVNYRIILPEKYALHTMPPHNSDEDADNKRIYHIERQDAADPGLMMKWDGGEH